MRWHASIDARIPDDQPGVLETEIAHLIANLDDAAVTSTLRTVAAAVSVEAGTVEEAAGEAIRAFRLAARAGAVVVKAVVMTESELVGG